MSNPLSLVYDKLWAMVEAHPDVATIVSAGNRIKFNDPAIRDVWKDRVASSDVPELVLVPDAGSVNLHATSSSSRVTRQYSWLISTGDLRLGAYLHAVEFMLIVAYSEWDTHLKTVEWPDASGKFPVTRCKLVDARVGHSDPQLNRRLKGWSAVWSCEVEFHFDTSDLRAIMNP